jgi:hypothetical protein
MSKRKHEYFIENRELILEFSFDDINDEDNYECIEVYLNELKRLAKKKWEINQTKESKVQIIINVTKEL